MPAASRVLEGDIIPPFTLKNFDGRIVSTDGFLRKKNLIILCLRTLYDAAVQRYLAVLQSVYGRLERENAEVLAVVGSDASLLGRFAKHNNITFNLLSDQDELTLRTFVSYAQDQCVYAMFIVDTFSSLYKMYLSDSPDKLPSTDEIIISVEFLEKQCPECGVATWSGR